MGLKLFNTLGRQLQDFVPINSGFVGFYGCGPTVYNYAHIGNLRAYVFLDTLDRALTFLGFDKKHVMNITDVGHLTGDDDTGEDKMAKSAEERKMSVMEVADFYAKAFMTDIKALNILTPDVVCRATDHIGDMIDLIRRIEANGHTYLAGGNLYYDVSTFADYPKLANLDMEGLRAGARVEVDPNKRSPFDFVLWFTKSKYENHALIWDSPWGAGYPGWHIECSAMSMKYLGEHFDIHTGGIDHIRIHHTNEIAQSEGATGKKWVNYWLHNEFLVIAKEGGQDAQKMSKSTGNFLRLQSLIDAGFDPLDYRYFLLTAHYRKQAFFSFDALKGAKAARASLTQKVAKLLKGCKTPFEHKVFKKGEAADCALLGEGAVAAIEKFKVAIESDLSTPMALSALSAVFKDKSLACEVALSLVDRMDSVLALDLINGAKTLLQKEATTQINLDTSEKCFDESFSSEEVTKIRSLIAERDKAKAAKDYSKSDSIRSELKSMGVVLIDTPNGVTWKKG